MPLTRATEAVRRRGAASLITRRGLVRAPTGSALAVTHRAPSVHEESEKSGTVILRDAAHPRGSLAADTEELKALLE